MKNRTFLYLVTVGILVPLLTFSQNSLDSVLANVRQNNKSIQAYEQLMEAKKAEYKTGLYLSNPTVEYEYMNGSPATAGNQVDFLALQTFDFPTAYVKRKALSNASIDRLELQAKAYRQDILLEAKLSYLQLVYLNKYRGRLIQRKDNAEKVGAAMQQKFDRGDANILELNKTKIGLTGIQNKLRQVESEMAGYTQNLVQLNGGVEIIITDTLYPPAGELPVLEDIYSEAVAGDYTLQAIQQDQQISGKQTELSRALALPKLEGGYRYQSILGQRFNGFHAGISIPLFENKNRVLASKQQAVYYGLLEESHVNEHHNELEALYRKSESLKKGIGDYRQSFSSIDSERLLYRALELGEISSIEYFMELSYYYQVYDDFLLMERDYYLILAELLKYRLM